MISYWHYSLDITPVDFFLFPRVKSELAGLLLSQDGFRTSWVGVMRTITKDEFATAFWQWYEFCFKCMQTAMTSLRKNGKYTPFQLKLLPFYWNHERCYKSIQINDDYFEKNRETSTFLTCIVAFLLKYSCLILIPFDSESYRITDTPIIKLTSYKKRKQ